MPILKDCQVFGPFKAGIVGRKANIGCGETTSGLEIDNKLPFINTSRVITHIGIQCDQAVPSRYIEEFKKDKDKIKENLPQNILKNYFVDKSINFKPTSNDTVYTDNKEDKEVYYYYNKLSLEDGEIKTYPEYDICIKGVNKNLSSTGETDNTFEEYFMIPETGILEFDNMDCISLEIYFLRDMPPQTMVDIIWTYKG